MIRILSDESTVTYRTNQTILGLTYAIIGVTLLTARSTIIELVE